MPRQTRTVECAECGKEFEASSARAKYCSPAHRKAASRRPSKKGAGEVVQLDKAAPELDLTSYDGFTVLRQVHIELVELNAVDTTEGVMALAIARRVESPMETGSAASTMTRELSRLMAEIRRMSGSKVDGLAGIETGAEQKLRLVK